MIDYTSNHAPLSGLAFSIELDGKSGWVELADYKEIRGDMTVEFWTNPRTTTKGQNMVGKHSISGSNEFLVGFFNNKYLLRVRKGSVVSVADPVAGPQHIAATVTKLAPDSSELVTPPGRNHDRHRSDLKLIRRSLFDDWCGGLAGAVP